MNPYETAYQLACDKLARLDLDDVAFNSSARLEDGKLYLNLAGQTFVIADKGRRIYHEQVRPEDKSSSLSEGKEPTLDVKISEKILLLHYLVTADGTRLAGQEVALRDIASAAFYYPTYKARSIDVIQKTFGDDSQRFLKVVKALGWAVSETPSLIKAKCLALPNVPITFIYRPASAEFSASLDILYDASITHYLPLEDIIIITELLSHRLARVNPDLPYLA